MLFSFFNWDLGSFIRILERIEITTWSKNKVNAHHISFNNPLKKLPVCKAARVFKKHVFHAHTFLGWIPSNRLGELRELLQSKNWSLLKLCVQPFVSLLLWMEVQHFSLAQDAPLKRKQCVAINISMSFHYCKHAETLRPSCLSWSEKT